MFELSQALDEWFDRLESEAGWHYEADLAVAPGLKLLGQYPDAAPVNGGELGGHGLAAGGCRSRIGMMILEGPEPVPAARARTATTAAGGSFPGV